MTTHFASRPFKIGLDKMCLMGSAFEITDLHVMLEFLDGKDE